MELLGLNFSLPVPAVSGLFRRKTCRRLLGRWGGQFKLESRDQIHYQICVAICECLDKRLDALLYYEGFNTTRLFCRGLDRLIKGTGNSIDPQNSSWKPTFERKAHEWIDFDPKQDQLLGATHRERRSYDWDCTVTDWSTTASMKVQARGELNGRSGLIFDGILLKD